MGFLRRIFGCKKPASPSGASHKSSSETVKSKRRWSIIKHSKDKSQSATSDLNHIDLSTSSLPYSDSMNANKHAIAVAAATAAVADAALAAAHAAAEVVRLTNGGGGGAGLGPSTSQLRWPEEIAAVRIQSAFRGYLAKRALRALKALVKLQALVRGHIVRKQTADMLRRMQTLVRLQSRARADRVQLSHILHSTKSPLSHHPVPEHYETSLRSNSTKFEGDPLLKRCNSNSNYRDIGSGRSRVVSQWYDQWMEENVWNLPSREDDEKSDKILEVDTWKPHLNSHQNENRLAYEAPSKRSTKSLNHSLFFSSLKFQKRKQEKASTNSRELSPAHSYQNSPSESFSASRRRSGAFTPTRSECSYFGHPNYMANTESSRAKARSVSARRYRLWDSAGNHSDTHNSDFRTQCFTSSSRFNRVLSTHLR